MGCCGLKLLEVSSGYGLVCVCVLVWRRDSVRVTAKTFKEVSLALNPQL